MQYVIFITQRSTIMWTKPEAVEMRYGFEVTMYVMNR
jgi:coenzyme PQQ precursor peptide PqqA